LVVLWFLLLDRRYRRFLTPEPHPVEVYGRIKREQAMKRRRFKAGHVPRAIVRRTPNQASHHFCEFGRIAGSTSFLSISIRPPPR